MATNPLAPVLSAPSSVPLYLSRFEIAVEFVSALPEEDQEILEDTISDFEEALQLGFFAWSFFNKRDVARLTVEWTEAGFVLHAAAAGLHHNVLVALLRLIVNVHHTPSEGRDAMIAALGEDAVALREPMVFSQVIKSVRIGQVEGADTRLAARTDFFNFAADDEIGTVTGATFQDPLESWDGDRITLSADLVDDNDRFDHIEDSFLRLYDIGCFVSLDTIDELAGDPEMFLSSNGGTNQIVIDDYEGDLYGLLELLNVVCNGQLSRVSEAERS